MEKMFAIPGQKKIKILNILLSSSGNNPFLLNFPPDSVVVNSCIHNHLFAARRWREVTVHILKTASPSSFPFFPSAPPPPASHPHPIKSKPRVLLFPHSQSELSVQPIVYLVERKGGDSGGGGILKGDEPLNIEAAMTHTYKYIYLWRERCISILSPLIMCVYGGVRVCV